jgi:gas vesicle protein
VPSAGAEAAGAAAAGAATGAAAGASAGLPQADSVATASTTPTEDNKRNTAEQLTDFMKFSGRAFLLPTKSSPHFLSNAYKPGNNTKKADLNNRQKLVSVCTNTCDRQREFLQTTTENFNKEEQWLQQQPTGTRHHP